MTRAKAQRALYLYRGQKVADAYMAEAEHGEGVAYWGTFADTDELLQDADAWLSHGGMADNVEQPK